MLGKSQQLRADLQTGKPGGFHINFKTYFPLARDEFDHAAGARKTFAFADRQNGCSLQLAKNLEQSQIGFEGSDKKNMARPEIFSVAQSGHGESSAFEGFEFQQLVEVGAEGVFAQDADRDRRAVVCESLRRPLDEFGKIVQKGRLELVLGRRRKIGILRITRHTACLCYAHHEKNFLHHAYLPEPLLNKILSELNFSHWLPTAPHTDTSQSPGESGVYSSLHFRRLNIK